MARLIELKTEDYEDCYRDQRFNDMPNDDFKDILIRPEFQKLTKNLLENHEYYTLTEGEVYDINNHYFRWNGRMMVEIPDTEITQEMEDDRIDLTSADYINQFEKDYEDETEENMPYFENIESMHDFEAWVIKTLKFKNIEPSHGDVIRVTNDDHRNNSKYQWDDINKTLVSLCYKYDDYGSCNPMFRVGEGFSPGDWCWNDEGPIVHNTIVFLTEKLVDKINTKLVPAECGYKCVIEIYGGVYKFFMKQSKLDSKNESDCAFRYYPEDKMLMPWP
jgi:hypothetical protein